MGSKAGAGVYQAIIALMPPHDTYIEPFLGSGAIVRRKAPAARSILIDMDSDAVNRAPTGPRIEVLQADALAYLATLDVGQLGRVLIYLDPPYPHSTRTSRLRYRHELADEGHRQLARILTYLSWHGCSIIISSYPSALYDELYPGWSTREFQAMTRGGVRTEKVWFNFEPTAAHWSTYAGRDFTDRQRIKRKAQRWARKFAELPPAERQAVLAALLEVGDRGPPDLTMPESRSSQTVLTMDAGAAGPMEPGGITALDYVGRADATAEGA
ncbi:DNA adenine methylase [Phenylobacterium sp.]|uniref:DNA adenine methylase n=1 Tax=Phenylobacterium sp. TaxID=1871053 RepID=UPI00301D6F6B